MRPELMLLPMGALAALTFIVLNLIPFHRFRAAFAGHVEAEDFRYGESGRVPGSVSIPNRNYMNLLEMPMLFYAVGTLSYVTAHVDAIAVALAWAYVAVRALHSLVHLTYNNVFHRLTLFALSNLVLAGLWVLLFARIIA